MAMTPIERAEMNTMALQQELYAQQRINAILTAQVSMLRAAMREARGFARERGNTLRSFAQRCGVTPTQMSEWTAEPIDSNPDFIDGTDDRRQDNA